MPEVAADRVRLRVIPVVGQLDLRRVALAALAEEHQREPALLVVSATDLGQPEALAEEVDRRSQVADPDHRVQVAHTRFVSRFWVSCAR